MNWYARSILALVAVSLQAATTTVVGTYSNTDGTPSTGSVVIQVTRSFTAADGKFVPVQKKVYSIVAGKVSIPLEPNSGSTPASFYTVATSLNNGPAENTIWIVPVSSTPVTVASVVASAPPAASQLIPPQQISGTGASIGSVLTYNGTQYAPAAAAPGGVTSVNSKTGAVVLVPSDIGAQTALGYTPENSANKGASNGYAPLSGGVVPNTNIPTGIDAAKLADGSVSNAELQRIDGLTSNAQTQIDSKQVKRSEVALDDYCTTSGVYDGTCWTNAISANPSGTKFFVGGHTYTTSTKIINSAKTDLYFYSNDKNAILKAANGLNDDLVAFTSCHRCVMEGFTLDGNGANQSAGYAFHSISSTNVSLDNMTLVNPLAANAKFEEVLFSSITSAPIIINSRFKNRTGVATKNVLVEGVNGMTIRNNTFECYAETCIDITTVSGGTIANNRFQLLDSTAYPTYSSSTAVKVSAGTPFTPLRVNFGTVGTANAGTDSNGNSWSATCGIYTYTVSSLPNTGTTIAGAAAADQFIFQNGARRSSGSFILISFDTNTSSHQACASTFTQGGKYTMKMYFADYLSSGAGQNVQDVKLGTSGGGTVTLESGLDIFAQAGGSFTALVKSYPVYIAPTSSTSVNFTVQMTRVTGSATITGMEIIPMPASSVSITPANTLEEFTASQTKILTPTVTGGATNQIRCIPFHPSSTAYFTVTTINGNTQCQVTAAAFVSAPTNYTPLVIQSIDDPGFGEVVILSGTRNQLSPHISPSSTVTLAPAGTQAFTGSYTGGGNPNLYWGIAVGGGSLSVSNNSVPSQSITYTAPASTGAPYYLTVYSTNNLYDYGLLKFNSFGNNGINISENSEESNQFTARPWVTVGGSLTGSGAYISGNKATSSAGITNTQTLDNYTINNATYPFGYLMIGPSQGNLCTNNTCLSSSVYSTFNESYQIPIAQCQGGTATSTLGFGGSVAPTFSCLTNVPYATFTKTTDGFLYFEHIPRRSQTAITTTTTSAVQLSDYIAFGGYYSASTTGQAVMKFEMACAYGGTTDLSSLTWRILGMIGPTNAHTTPRLNYSGRGTYNSGTYTSNSQLAADNCFQSPTSGSFQTRWYFRVSRAIADANDTNSSDFRLTNLTVFGKYLNAQ